MSEQHIPDGTILNGDPINAKSHTVTPFVMREGNGQYRWRVGIRIEQDGQETRNMSWNCATSVLDGLRQAYYQAVHWIERNATGIYILTTPFTPNSAVVRDAGLLMPDLPAAHDNIWRLVGTHRALIKVASFIRWDWITSNGYNMIRVEREPGFVRYEVLPHFGIPAYELCRVAKSQRRSD